MAYVPDPTDATQPTDAIIAETAQAEFRALKAYIQTLVLGASGVKAPVRQTVIAALIAASTGLPAYAVAGAGLSVNVLATAFPVIMSIANGFDINGPSNLNTQITVDAPAAWAAIPANNTSYLSYDMLTAATGTYTQSLAPYQESTVYNQAAQSLNHFNGANGAVVSLDDFGPTWAFQGGAKLVNNYLPLALSTSSLGGTGAGGALDGATQYAKSVSFTSLGSNGWTLRCKTKPLNALPGAGASWDIIAATNAGGFGARLVVNNTAGTIRFGYLLSSTGAANDITALAVGTTLPVLGTAYDLELTFDALAGVYRLYVAGAQEQNTASALKICSITQICNGSNNGTAGSFYQGCIGEFESQPYCQHPAGTGFAIPVVASNVSTAGYSSDYFSINEMKTWQVSGPSTVAGNNPAFTQKNRVYMLEVDTSGAAVTALRIRALNGKCVTPVVSPLPGVSVSTPIVHNLGTNPKSVYKQPEVFAVCITSDAANGYVVGQVVPLTTCSASLPQNPMSNKDRNNGTMQSGSNGTGWFLPIISGGNTGNATAANWGYFTVWSRGWGGA